MARYFFHVFNDEKTHDDEGVEFASLEAAQAHALLSARNLAAESIIHCGHLVLHHRIDIENENGAHVSTVQFRDAFDILE